jgi:hypothetical protein
MTPPAETLHSSAARAWLRCLIALSLATAAAPGRAQETQAPSWIIPDVAAAARAEGSLTVYSSMNEQEGLPLWKMFEDATGVKVHYVRSSDSIISRASPSRTAPGSAAGMSRSPPR